MSRARTRETVVLFTVGEARFAIAASAVKEICDLAAVTLLDLGAPRHTGAVRQMLRRKREQRLVVDARIFFGLGGDVQHVLLLRHEGVAVLVGGVDRMQEIATLYRLPSAFHGKECQWYRGLALLPEGVVPVVQPESLVKEVVRAKRAEKAIA